MQQITHFTHCQMDWNTKIIPETGNRASQYFSSCTLILFMSLDLVSFTQHHGNQCCTANLLLRRLIFRTDWTLRPAITESPLVHMDNLLQCKFKAALMNMCPIYYCLKWGYIARFTQWWTHRELSTDYSSPQLYRHF